MNQGVRGLIGWCSATLLVSAFLLFQIQPVVSKMILPWFGGGPAVWTTCMLFFQIFLLLGYAYAHLLDRFARTSIPAVIHLILLGVALYVLPIAPSASWKPPDSTAPQWRILLLLSANVGLPYLLLAASAPLVQAWYGRIEPGRSPYRFYALSNVGSLAALLSYPFLIEPRMDTPAQGMWWSIGFGLFVVLCGGLTFALFRWNVPVSGVVERQDVDPTQLQAQAQDPTVSHYLAWLLLPAFGSVCLLAVTNQICQDVAVVPFLWIAPLSLYLLTFILCFDSDRWYWRGIFSLWTIVVAVVISAILLSDQLQPLLDRLHINYELPDILDSLQLEVTLYLALLFSICMLCHGELVRCKPATRYLTSFYLLIAAGGAIGGSFVAMACPVIFTSHVESTVTLIGGFLFAQLLIALWLWKKRGARRIWWSIVLAIPMIATACVVLAVPLKSFVSTDYDSPSLLTARRNFYGVLKVTRRGEVGGENERRVLLNGRILHGVQYWSEERRREPTTYYGRMSGIGLVLEQLALEQLALDQRAGDRPLRVGTVGLGTGTIAAYGRLDDDYCFYEINPDVVDICHQFFTFLEDCPANVRVLLGDARLTMEQQPPQNFDVLALDAFSGDAIPVHLLTVEAFHIYMRHIRPDGVIAVHVSNRHLDLNPIVVQLADHYELEVVEVDAIDEGDIGDSSSQWLLMTKNKKFLEGELISPEISDLEPPRAGVRVWTDQYSNLFQILK